MTACLVMPDSMLIGVVASVRFNRELNIDKNPHRDEKTLARQIAESSDGKYASAQVEDQLRIMGVTIDGKHQTGSPATLVGEEPKDPGAKWVSAGTTSDGKPIRTQVTAQADPELQSYILAKYNSVGKEQVPSVFAYDLPEGNDWKFSMPKLTGPFTRLPNEAEIIDMKNTGAGGAAFVSTQAGRVSSTAAAAASVPGPHQPTAATVAAGSAMVGLVADAVSQVLRPDATTMFKDNVLIGIPASVLGDRFPLVAPVINEIGEKVKESTK